MMTTPAITVNMLLEAANACASCQKELGIRPSEGDSHGYCKFHAIQFYMNFAEKHGGNPQEMMAEMQRIKNAQDEEFPPCLVCNQEEAA